MLLAFEIVRARCLNRSKELKEGKILVLNCRELFFFFKFYFITGNREFRINMVLRETLLHVSIVNVFQHIPSKSRFILNTKSKKRNFSKK